MPVVRDALDDVSGAAAGAGTSESSASDAGTLAGSKRLRRDRDLTSSHGLARADATGSSSLPVTLALEQAVSSDLERS